ncbi:MAG: phosphatidylinositol-specific phospholipase C1-like protein [Steroidobacter sp.]
MLRLLALSSSLLLLACTAGADALCDLSSPRPPPGSKCASAWQDENLRVNDLTSLGTHNSYKRAIPGKELALLHSRSPGAATSLDYAHRPIEQQLQFGARQLELDIHIDKDGKRFANPLAARLTATPLEADFEAEMAQPGFKVMHVPDIDFRSNCLSFIACLQIIRTWSEANPDHTPLLILINAKDDPSPVPGGASVEKFSTADFDALDAEIASVFAAYRLITPDEVRGSHPTLRTAVLAGNWPRLRDARGRILFALDDNPEKVALYQGERHSLGGRLMFVNTDESSPAAAYLTLNDPIREAQRIRAAVDAGFLVRTRADADTVEARSGSTSRRDAALSSGAQYISTDYMQPDARFSSYSVQLPADAVSICNPVRTRERCSGQTIVEPMQRRQ